MKAKRMVWFILTILLTSLVVFTQACTGILDILEILPTGIVEIVPAEDTYSKHGFSVGYPHGATIKESGGRESNATFNEGSVMFGLVEKGMQIYEVTWTKSFSSPNYEYVMESGLARLEESGVISDLGRGKLRETTKDGYPLLYQYYSFKAAGEEAQSLNVAGEEMEGVVACFYCDSSQRAFAFITMNNIYDYDLDVVEDFFGFIEDFDCQ